MRHIITVVTVVKLIIAIYVSKKLFKPVISLKRHQIFFCNYANEIAKKDEEIFGVTNTLMTRFLKQIFGAP